MFRIGSFIPIPGIDAAVLAKLLEQQRGTIIEMFNMFSGGALSRASTVALGIMPYISASIIIQLLTVAHPALAELKKEGESGRRKISQYTRYGISGAGNIPVDRYCYRSSEYAWYAGPGIKPRLCILFHRCCKSGHRDHVPDVARRTDY